MMFGILKLQVLDGDALEKAAAVYKPHREVELILWVIATADTHKSPPRLADTQFERARSQGQKRLGALSQRTLPVHWLGKLPGVKQFEMPGINRQPDGPTFQAEHLFG